MSGSFTRVSNKLVAELLNSLRIQMVTIHRESIRLRAQGVDEATLITIENIQADMQKIYTDFGGGYYDPLTSEYD